MVRFIVASFFVTGLAFYQLSGGADFVPEVRGEAKVNPLLDVAARADTGEVDLVSVRQATAKEPDVAGQTHVADKVGFATVTRHGSSSGEFFRVLHPAGVEASAPKPLEPTIAVVEEQPDLRQINGTRVNLRTGPGTQYSVVAKLTKGQNVEVLQAPGNGWVKLRVVDSQKIGWMADFLVTAKAE